MELKKWRYFLFAAEEGNFVRAANRLHVSQPALSQRIHELEEELGVRLFDRMPRGVRLSQAGEVFLGEARRLLEEVDQAIELTRRTGRGDVGVLRVAFNEIFAQQRIFAEALHRYRNVFPKVSIDLLPLNGPQQQTALRRDAIDVGFHHQPEQARGLDWMESLPIRSEHFVLAICKGAALAKKRLISPEDLAGHTIISSSYRKSILGSRDYLSDCLAGLGVTPTNLVETGSDFAVVNLASVGMGIGIVLSSHRAKTDDMVVYRELPGKLPTIKAVIAWRRGNGSVQLIRFIEIARQVETAMRAKG